MTHVRKATPSTPWGTPGSQPEPSSPSPGQDVQEGAHHPAHTNGHRALQPHTHGWPRGPCGSRCSGSAVSPGKANQTLQGNRGERQGLQWGGVPLPLSRAPGSPTVPSLLGAPAGQAARCPL